MEDNENKRLRYSVWPDQTIEVPPVLVCSAELRKGEIFYDHRGEHPSRFAGEDMNHVHNVDLPSELYLRELMALDLKSDDAILAFVQEFGALGYAGRLGEDRTTTPFAFLPNWLSLDPKSYLRSTKYNPDRLQPKKHVRGYAVQTLESARIHASALRDAVRLWQVQSGQMTLDVLGQEWELPAVPFWDTYYLQEVREAMKHGWEVLAFRKWAASKGHVNLLPPQDANTALVVLSEILAPGLKWFTPELYILSPGADSPTTQITSLYPALCLQLFNHIAEEAIYLRCHNEKCGRLFVRQRGRARQGKYHTSGVMYCSDYCARAQGQREIRRRKAKSSARGRREQP